MATPVTAVSDGAGKAACTIGRSAVGIEREREIAQEEAPQRAHGDAIGLEEHQPIDRELLVGIHQRLDVTDGSRDR